MTGGVSSTRGRCRPGGLFVARRRRARRRPRLRRRGGRGAGPSPCLAAASGRRAAACVVDDAAGRARPAGPRAGRLDRAAGRLVVVGVTGSSRQDLDQGPARRRCSSRPGRRSRRAGSFNNEIGLPLTRCGATPTTRYLVARDGRPRRRPHRLPVPGSRRRGSASCSTSAPRTLGEFGSAEAIARGQGRAGRGAAAPDGGVAVLNADDPLVRGDGRPAPLPGWSRVGIGADADVRADGRRARRRAAAPSFDLRRPPAGAAPRDAAAARRAPRLERARGRRGRRSSSGCAVDGSPRRSRRRPPRSRWRMEVVERADGVTVVNDAYNANPDSMRAALAGAGRDGAAAGAPGRCSARCSSSARRRATEHDDGRQTGRAARASHRLVVVGDGARGRSHAGARARGVLERRGVRARADADAALAAAARASSRPGDVVLVKASRGGGLERVARRCSRRRRSRAGTAS